MQEAITAKVLKTVALVAGIAALALTGAGLIGGVAFAASFVSATGVALASAISIATAPPAPTAFGYQMKEHPP